jgi:salicylate hydroxylase
MTTPTARPILIAGGGIAGLASALALADCGLASLILERTTQASEAGAGIQIGPNGVKALRALGVAEDLSEVVGVPSAIHIRDARSSRTLASLPLGNAIKERMGAPYWTAHRADLHAALSRRAQGLALIRLASGFEVASVEATATGVKVQSTSGQTVTGHALIGADGIGSRVRSYVAQAASPKLTQRRAYRSIIDGHNVPAGIDQTATGLWLTGGAHVVHYPVRGGNQVAIVVILTDPHSSRGWSQPEDPEALLGKVKQVHPSLQALISAAPEWRSWALVDQAPLERWANGRVVLVGDAAHPVLPFLAQGGVLALEDAVTLAPLLAKHIANPATAFEAFEKVRRKRALRVHAASRANGTLYHLRGPAAVARNLALQALTGPQLLSRYDWLYGWQPPAPDTTK